MITAPRFVFQSDLLFGEVLLSCCSRLFEAHFFHITSFIWEISGRFEVRIYHARNGS